MTPQSSPLTPVEAETVRHTEGADGKVTIPYTGGKRLAMKPGAPEIALLARAIFRASFADDEDEALVVRKYSEWPEDQAKAIRAAKFVLKALGGDGSVAAILRATGDEVTAGKGVVPHSTEPKGVGPGIVERDADGLDIVEALVADACAAERSRGVHEGGEYYAERIIRRALEQGTLTLGNPPRGHEHTLASGDALSNDGGGSRG